MKLNRKTLKQMVLEEYNAMMKEENLADDRIAGPEGQELVDDDPMVKLKSELVQRIKTDFVDKIRDAQGVQASEASILMTLLNAVLEVVDSTTVSDSESELMIDKIRQIAGAQKEM